MAKMTGMSSPAPAGTEDDSEPQEYEVKDAADTLLRAEEIKKNKKLMPHVHRHLNNKMKQIGSIQDLRDKKAALDDSDDGAGPYSDPSSDLENPAKHVNKVVKASKV